MNPVFLLLPLAASLLSPPASYWNKGRGYGPFANATPDGIRIANDSPLPVADSCRLAEELPSFVMTFRASADASWGFFVAPEGKERLWFSVSRTEKPGAFSSSPALLVGAGIEGEKTDLAAATVDDGLAILNGANVWRLSCSDGIASLRAGNRSLTPVVSFPLADTGIASFGFAASPGCSLLVEDVAIVPASPLPAYATIDPSRIAATVAGSADPLEGYWAPFDRQLEEDLLRLGGDYRLAIVKEQTRYLMVYLGGAQVNAGKWRPGMVKAILTPGPFPGIFDVCWIDAEGLPLSRDIKAQTGEEDTLLFQFPYQSSSLRLRKTK